MKKIALFFPGQGSQYVGMAKNLIEDQTELFKDAEDSLGFSIKNIMLEGPEEQLTLTENTQPAIVTHSVALLNQLNSVLENHDIEITHVLGHSVGEYSALVANKVLSFKDAVRLVHLRGKFMQAAVPAGLGSMHAILKVPHDMIIKACEEASNEDSKVMPANFNEPNQTVISGHKDACLRAISFLEENLETPFRAVELKVSAPFHSSLMVPARENLKPELEKATFNSPSIPYIANVDSKTYGSETAGSTCLENLLKQVDGSVMWSQSVAQLSDDTLCIEVGPGKVLKGLARKINRNLKVVSLDNEDAFSELKDLL